jgi:secretion/DNA translocation related TadE-like protein
VVTYGLIRVVRQERGSATVWAIALCSLLLCVALFGLTLAQAALTRQRVAMAADLAALAAAGSWRDQCTRARSVAEANGAALVTCTMSPGGVAVAVSLPAPSLVTRLIQWIGQTPKPFVGQARAG